MKQIVFRFSLYDIFLFSKWLFHYPSVDAFLTAKSFETPETNEQNMLSFRMIQSTRRKFVYTTLSSFHKKRFSPCIQNSTVTRDGIRLKTFCKNSLQNQVKVLLAWVIKLTIWIPNSFYVWRNLFLERLEHLRQWFRNVKIILITKSKHIHILTYYTLLNVSKKIISEINMRNEYFAIKS